MDALIVGLDRTLVLHTIITWSSDEADFGEKPSAASAAADPAKAAKDAVKAATEQH